jgi:hypothetical protein
MTTFYMVEMHYPATEDRARFDEFYWKHITMLLTIDGFQSAQRYECLHEAKAPFLAIYRLREPGVMTSENYTSKAGRNSVAPTFRAKMTNWDRNLVQGDIATMDVPDGGHLVLIDRLSKDSPPLPDGFTPLKIVGLDATIVERGVRIFAKGEAVPTLKPVKDWTVRTFKPIHAVRYPA